MRKRRNFTLNGELLPREQRFGSRNQIWDQTSPQFTSKGELVSRDQSVDKSGLEQSFIALEQYREPLFKVLFSIPEEYVKKYVKNPKEGELLLAISEAGNNFDTLIQSLADELRKSESGDQIHNWEVSNKSENRTALALPFGDPNSEHFKNIQGLMDKISKELEKLWHFKSALNQFAETNKFLSTELKAEACDKLAQEKLIISNAEALLASRLDDLFEKNPYAHALGSWESIFEAQSHKRKLEESLVADEVYSQFPNKRIHVGEPQEEGDENGSPKQGGNSMIEQDSPSVLSPISFPSNLEDVSFTQLPPKKK